MTDDLQMSPFLEVMAPLLIATGILWGAIIRIFVSIRRERIRSAKGK